MLCVNNQSLFQETLIYWFYRSTQSEKGKIASDVRDYTNGEPILRVADYSSRIKADTRIALKAGGKEASKPIRITVRATIKKSDTLMLIG